MHNNKGWRWSDTGIFSDCNTQVLEVVLTTPSQYLSIVYLYDVVQRRVEYGGGEVFAYTYTEGDRYWTSDAYTSPVSVPFTVKPVRVLEVLMT